MHRVFIALSFMLLASTSLEAQVVRRVDIVAGFPMVDPRSCQLPELPGIVIARWIPDASRDRIVFCVEAAPQAAQTYRYTLYVRSASIDLEWTPFELAPLCGYAATVVGAADPVRSICSSYMHPYVEAALLNPGGAKVLSIAGQTKPDAAEGPRSAEVHFDTPRCIGIDLMSGDWPKADNKVYNIGDTISARRSWRLSAQTAAVSMLRRGGWRVEHEREQWAAPTDDGSLNGGYYYTSAYCVGFSTL